MRMGARTATCLWLAAAAAGGFAVGAEARLTLLVLAGAAGLVLLLGRVELAAAALVVASCFEDYLATVSPVIVKAMAVVLIGSWAIRRSRGRVDPRRADHPGPLAWAVVALTVVLLLSAVAHGGGPGVADSLARWAGFIAALVVLADVVRGRAAVEWLAGVYVAACAAAAVCGLLTYARGAARVGGPIDDPNDFAIFLLAALPLSLALRRTGSRPWVWDVATVVIAVATAGTVSRGAGVGVVAMLVFAGVTRQISRTSLLGVVGAVVATASVAVGLFPEQVRRSFEQKTAVAGQNVSERFYLWHSAEQMTLDNPLVGQGPGSFALEHQSYVDRLPLDVDHLLDVAHNTYLEVAAELGLLGLAAFVAVLVIGFRGAWQAWRRDASPIAAAVTCALVGVAVGATFLSEQFYLPFWLLTALGAGLAVRAPVARPAAALEAAR